MKYMRVLTLIIGLVCLVLGVGFVFRAPLVINLWPWEDGRYSYLFVGSILAAVSTAALWIGWTGELGALPAGTLNIFVIAVATSVYFFRLASQGRPELFLYGIFSVITALLSGMSFLWTRKLPLTDTRPTPNLVRISFGFFTASLILSGIALVLRLPVFPWDLNPDSSIIFGCIFLGDAFYFLYGLLRPQWGNARGQLLSFLAYDLVLIVPFLLLFNTVNPDRMIGLIVYVAVLVYSGGLAFYFLIINSFTRLGTRS